MEELLNTTFEGALKNWEIGERQAVTAPRPVWLHHPIRRHHSLSCPHPCPRHPHPRPPRPGPFAAWVGKTSVFNELDLQWDFAISLPGQHLTRRAGAAGGSQQQQQQQQGPAAGEGEAQGRQVGRSGSGCSSGRDSGDVGGGGGTDRGLSFGGAVALAAEAGSGSSSSSSCGSCGSLGGGGGSIVDVRGNGVAQVGVQRGGAGSSAKCCWREGGGTGWHMQQSPGRTASSNLCMCTSNRLVPPDQQSKDESRDLCTRRYDSSPQCWPTPPPALPSTPTRPAPQRNRSPRPPGVRAGGGHPRGRAVVAGGVAQARRARHRRGPAPLRGGGGPPGVASLRAGGGRGGRLGHIPVALPGGYGREVKAAAKRYAEAWIGLWRGHGRARLLEQRCWW